MTSSIGEMLSQNQHSLQQLQMQQQSARSLTSADCKNLQQSGIITSSGNINGNRVSVVSHGQTTIPYPTDNISIDVSQPRGSVSADPGVQGTPGVLEEGLSFSHLPPNNRQQQTNSLTSSNTHVSRNRVSLQRHRSNNQQDPRSPLVVLMPTNANPTEVLSQRFAAWRSIIRSLLVYLKETVSIQDELVRQHMRLQHAINFPFFTIDSQHQPSTVEDKNIQKFFLPLGHGSVQDLPTLFNQYHTQMVHAASRASKELSQDVIPRLEDMRSDLLVKIKEIQSLESDFRNSCGRELQETKIRFKAFQESLESSKYGSVKQDPFLAKIHLEKQIKKQLTEENFLHEAFNNLQSSGKELEKVVVMEIQNALTNYAKVLGQEAQLVFDVLISKLDTGFFNKDPVFEWESFVAKDSNFVDPDLPMRRIKEIVYKNQNDPFTYEIKSGILERRSKFLKSYSRGFYVLTPSFLHEFKSGDRKKDLIPVISLSLSDCTVAEHSKKGSSDFKFILHTKQNGIIHRGHNWVFRTDSYESMMDWFNNIKQLTSTSNPIEKARFVTEKLNLNGAPNKSILKHSTPQGEQVPRSSVDINDSILATPRTENEVQAFSETTGNTTLNNSTIEPINKASQFLTPKPPRKSGQYSLETNSKNNV
ncbi:unnamed protein product [Kluyveromyces dobzhanskii CBS 2104]|uniref:WGS project CCBQ000000000 data, contig 00015 n=1 Tax=Kluyveromyces dobzhanskii CBS 2104 TaxID=1427455 RepID=A0A0A8LBF3_9SACH|nr:unnamed protein product [Kluyveromyces dobzhanskii CBS 2104]